MSPSQGPELVADGYPARRPRWAQLATSADHKDIGQILICGALGFLFIALVELVLMRIQLLVPENTFLSPVGFNRMLSLYGASGLTPASVGVKTKVAYWATAPATQRARPTCPSRGSAVPRAPICSGTT